MKDVPWLSKQKSLGELARAGCGGPMAGQLQVNMGSECGLLLQETCK